MSIELTIMISLLLTLSACSIIVHDFSSCHYSELWCAHIDTSSPSCKKMLIEDNIKIGY